MLDGLDAIAMQEREQSDDSDGRGALLLPRFR